MYTDLEFEFIDNLLKESLNNDLTYPDLVYSSNFNFDLYNKLFTDINKEPYKLIELFNDTFVITTLGRQVSEIGFKKYLENQEKKNNIEQRIKEVTLENIKWTSIRGWIAIGISIAALIIACLSYINKNNEATRKNAQNKTDTTLQKNKITNKNLAIDSASTKEISDTSKLNSKKFKD